MGWLIGYDENWMRDVGYAVPAFCDKPGCDHVIDRGLAFVCGNMPFGGERGCGLYFCSDHHKGRHNLCSKCLNGCNPYPPKPDHPDWVKHKLTDPSWQEWRDKNPDFIKEHAK